MKFQRIVEPCTILNHLITIFRKILHAKPPKFSLSMSVHAHSRVPSTLNWPEETEPRSVPRVRRALVIPPSALPAYVRHRGKHRAARVRGRADPACVHVWIYMARVVRYSMMRQCHGLAYLTRDKIAFIASLLIELEKCPVSYFVRFYF